MLICVASSACAEAEKPSDVFEHSELSFTPATYTLGAGTSTEDLWLEQLTDALNAPTIRHRTGPEQWQSVSVGATGRLLALASTERDRLWVLGEGPVVLSHLEVNGLDVDDHTAELPSSLSTTSNPHMAAGRGGLFVAATASADPDDRLHAYRLVDDALVELQNTPAAVSARVLGVAGPDAAYFQLTHVAGGVTYVHYSAGAWTEIDWTDRSAPTLVVASSEDDVWFWEENHDQWGLHCNGATCSMLEISGWPQGTAGAEGLVEGFAIVPVARHEAAILAVTPLSAAHGEANIVSIRINDAGQVLSTKILFGCDHHGCEFDANDVVALPDGSISIVQESRIYEGSISDL